MLSTNEIIGRLGRIRLLSELIPLGHGRSVAIPGVDRGRPILGFVFYRVEGAAGRPKRIHAPAVRILIDKRSGGLGEIRLPPLLWLADHDASTVLGEFPGSGLAGLDLAAMDDLLRAYGEATDVLLAQDTSGDLEQAAGWADWLALFERVREDGLLPYFDIPGFPVRAVAEANTPLASAGASEAGGCFVAEAEGQAEGLPEDPIPVASPAEVLDLLETARKALRKIGQEPLLQEWRRIRGLLGAPAFQVAVVGDCSRGKTRLVDALLDGALTGAADLPATTLLTRVRAGRDAILTSVALDRSTRQGPLTPDRLAAAWRDAEQGAPRGVLEVQVPDTWLAEDRIALVDTPGVGDWATPAAEQVAETVASCDATLVVVSALAALSITEHALVEEHVLGSSVPRVAVVVARLDQLREVDRQSVIEYVTQRVRGWSPACEVWLSSTLAMADAPGLVAGAEAMRRRLTEWSRYPARSGQRAAQAAGQLAELLETARQALLARRDAARADAAERARTVQQARDALSAQQAHWESLRLDMEQRALATSTALRETLARAEPAIVERLRLELYRMPNPADWWSRELPFRLGQDLRGLSRALERQLGERLGRDGAWLAERLRRQFAEQVTPGAVRASAPLGAPSLDEVVADPTWIRTAARLTSAAAAAGSLMLLGPLGMLASSLVGLQVEHILSGRLQQQRQALAAKLSDVVHATLARAGDSLRGQVSQAYGQLGDQTRQREVHWLQAQIASIEHANAAGEAATAQPDRALLDEVTEIRKRLLGIVAGGSHASAR